MTAPLDPEILRQVQQLVRRDLKLSPQEPLAPEMPLFGSDIDLDSLDMLLLVTSLERTFGVRVPNQAIGREIFQSVGALAQYVQAHRGTASAGVAQVVLPRSQALSTSSSAASSPGIAAPDYLASLPHGPAFRFLSRVIDVQSGHSARGIWQLSGDESFFAAHFPGNPLVPGVLIGEALAQIAGIAAAPVGGTSRFQATLAQVDLRFERPVRPPAEIELSANVISIGDGFYRFDVVASTAGMVVSRGTLTLHSPSA